jgi:hypothetical protein
VGQNSPLPVLNETFAATGNATLSGGTSSTNVALPAAGQYVEVANGSATVDAYVTLGVGTGTTATVSGYLVKAGRTIFLATDGLSAGAATYIAAITSASTASLTITSGTLAPASGGGGGGTVSISQATPGTTNGVVTNAGSQTQANIAAGGVVAGSFLAGSFTSGAIADLGTATSPAAGTTNFLLGQVVTNTSNPLPAQSGHGVDIGAAELLDSGGIAVTNSTNHTVVVEGKGTSGSAVGGVLSQQGPIAAGATQTANPLPGGCTATNVEPTAVTTGQAVAQACGLSGKLINLPYANKENMARGAGSSTSTTAITILAASGSASQFEYLTSVQCSNVSATTDYVTLNDSASTVLINPSGGGNNVTFPVPLRVALNTAATATPHTGETTEFCSAQGYYGT